VLIHYKPSLILEAGDRSFPRGGRLLGTTASPPSGQYGSLILAAVRDPRRVVIPAIRDRAALGGGITLGLALTFDAEGDAFRFLNITVALLVVLVALYLRFRPGR
jgi:hypothetical protein